MALEEQNNADQTLEAAAVPGKSPGPASSPDPESQPTLDGNAAFGATIASTFPTRHSGIIAPKIDGYEITGRLGEGGMGVVWKATQHGTHRPVALKLMSAASFGSERARLRFQREVDLTARLEHPHIARVYDGGENRGICYYAMEFIDGVPLDQHVREQKFTRPQILQLMQTICEAVQYAHQKGVIHRDLKPANIMVDKQGQPHVLDFGLAKAFAEHDDQMLSLDIGTAGTPAFMSPEQAAGHLDQVDTRSDVYTLGVILFHLLTGKYPHDVSGSALEVMKRISELEPCRLKAIEPRADRDLEALLSKALAKEPERRYGTAGDLAADLGRYLNGEPLVAQPPTMKYLIGKRLRKYRIPLSIAAGVCLVLVGMAVWSYVRVTKERNTAQAAKDVALAANIEKEKQRQEAESQRNEAIQQRTEAQQQRAEARQQKDEAQKQKLEADRQRNDAIEQKRQAELRTAESLLAQGNAFGLAIRWGEARALYGEARDSFIKLDVPLLAVDAGLAKAYARSPAALLTFSGHEKPVNAVVVCPDGITAVTGSSDRTICIWDLKTGRLLRTLHGHTSTVTTVDVSSDGRFILSGSYDKTLKVWDFQTGNLLKTLVGHAAVVQSVAISPDGKTAISGGDDQVVRLWDLEAGTQIWASADQTTKINCVCFMPDGRTALSAAGRYVTQWNWVDGKSLRTLNQSSGESINAMRVCGNGQQVLMAGNRDSILVDLQGKTIQTLRGHNAWVKSLAPFPDATTVISGSSDSTIKVWDLEKGREKFTFSGHTGEVNGTSLAADGRMVLSAGEDKTLKLWDLKGVQDVRVVKRLVHGVAISPDGRSGISANHDGTLTLFDMATGREIRTFRGSPHPIVGVAFSPEGKYALSANGELKTLSLWDLADGKEVRVMSGHDGDVTHVAVSPDGSTALSCSKDKTLKWWNLGSGKLIRTLSGHKHGVYDAAFSDDGRSAVSVTGGELKLWDLEKGSERTLQSPGYSSKSVAFCPDGSHVVAALGNNLGLADLQSGQVVRTFSGHTNYLPNHCIVVSPDGRFIISGSADRTMKVWDLRSGKELQSFDHEVGISNIALGPDGRTVLCGTNDNFTMEIWDWNRPAVYREMQGSVREAQAALQINPDDPKALAVLGRWWAFRGIDNWAAELLEKARAGGAEVSPLTLGRCYWQLDRFADARREFEKALTQAKDEPERYYLQLCIGALDRAQAAAKK